METLNLESYIKDTIINLKTVIAKLGKKGINLNGLESFIEKKEFEKFVLLLGGSQISGSLSPLLQSLNSLNQKGNEFLYTLINMEKELLNIKELIDFINTSDNILGSNVTMPYKIEAYKILKEKYKLDDIAVIAGAVNTIAKVDGVLTGYNTDVEGIRGPITNKLGENGLNNIKYAYLLGAGGAAKAAVSALLLIGVKNIKIFNRTKTNGENLIKHFNSKEVKEKIGLDYNLELVEYDLENNKNPNISDFIEENSILINTLPFGFKNELPVFPICETEIDKVLGKIRLYFDIVYDMNHDKTPLMKIIHNHFPKLLTCDGRDMLIGQAVKGFKLWTVGGKFDTQKANNLLR